MKKLTPKRVNNICLILVAIGILIALFGLSRDMLSIITIGIAVTFFSIIFNIIFYRCPHCCKFLDRSRGEYCPYCGKKINNSVE